MNRPVPAGVEGFALGTRGSRELSERLEIARELGCSVKDLPDDLAAAREVLAARLRQGGRIRPRGWLR